MQKNILVVDDRENCRRAIARCLTLYGYRTTEAVNGKDAVKKAEGGGFNLILMDVVMPDMTGPAAATRIRKQFSGMPVIYMSSYSAGETETYGGPERFLSKPFSVKDLLNEMEMLAAAEAIAT